MNQIGSIRRLDELGRIVIPKEIRNSLRIKPGDNFEIYLNGNDIILKKNSPLESFKELSHFIVQTLFTKIKKDILIVSGETIIENTDKNIKEKQISDELYNLISSRQATLFHSKKIYLTETYLINKDLIISPINVAGDILGALIITGEDLTEEIKNIAEILTTVLIKELEN